VTCEWGGGRVAVRQCRVHGIMMMWREKKDFLGFRFYSVTYDVITEVLSHTCSRGPLVGADSAGTVKGHAFDMWSFERIGKTD
jgi:hypothetical protein